ncbi:hypothetical protein ACFPRL_04435 [Pseudoclavibacter helvolus]
MHPSRMRPEARPVQNRTSTWQSRHRTHLRTLHLTTHHFRQVRSVRPAALQALRPEPGRRGVSPRSSSRARSRSLRSSWAPRCSV